MSVNIRIDRRRCDARTCTLCLQACPTKVLGRFPLDRERARLSAAFQIDIVFPQYCREGCRLCEQA